MKRLSTQAVTVLGSMDVEGWHARITKGQLERKLYAEVNAALVAIGGKWDRQAKAHSFEQDPRDALDQVVLSGGFVDLKQSFGFFETPVALADRMARLADIQARHQVLEPSAGKGRLVLAVDRLRLPVDVLAIDVQPKNVKALRALSVEVAALASLETKQDDFLMEGRRYLSPRFDRVVMNPPFARQADIEHVAKAFWLLKPGGKLISVMSAGLKFRDNAKTDVFRRLVQKCGAIVDLPEDTFRESGTSVSTVLVTMERPR